MRRDGMGWVRCVYKVTRTLATLKVSGVSHYYCDTSLAIRVAEVNVSGDWCALHLP
jgi:hypothetical protein